MLPHTADCFVSANPKGYDLNPKPHCRTLQYQWAAHQDANRKFAKVVFEHYQDGDMVWVQDYHLMLLPALLKNRKPKMKARSLFTCGRRNCIV